jgi:hypothetical protein
VAFVSQAHPRYRVYQCEICKKKGIKKQGCIEYIRAHVRMEHGIENDYDIDTQYTTRRFIS